MGGWVGVGGGVWWAWMCVNARARACECARGARVCACVRAAACLRVCGCCARACARVCSSFASTPSMTYLGQLGVPIRVEEAKHPNVVVQRLLALGFASAGCERHLGDADTPIRVSVEEVEDDVRLRFDGGRIPSADVAPFHGGGRCRSWGEGLLCFGQFPTHAWPYLDPIGSR